MRFWLVLLLACRGDSDPTIELARRDWHIHELVLVAGEKAADCPAAGTSMKALVAQYRTELAAAVATTSPENIKKVTSFIEAHPMEFPDFDDRWDALRDRCTKDPGVQQAFRDLGLAGLDQSPAAALPPPGGSE